jgi:hypothetical protein
VSDDGPQISADAVAGWCGSQAVDAAIAPTLAPANTSTPISRPLSSKSRLMLASKGSVLPTLGWTTVGGCKYT